MNDLGYKEDQYDSLLVFSEVVGETNFWFFFQLDPCTCLKTINSDIERIEWYTSLLSSVELTSTYKTPLYLQIRKWNGIQKRLLNCDDSLAKIARKPIESISIRIEDKNLKYYSDALKDGVNKDKMKSF
jgi:hypothetical protein